MTHHLPRLDSVRGIAALMVAGFHAGLSAGTDAWAVPIVWLLSFFFDGRNGVCIFFVLSGLVLGFSLRRSGELAASIYFHFCGRRLFRLYPAYLVSTFFYLLLYLGVRHLAARHHDVGHGWCDYYKTRPVSHAVLVKNFVFLSQYLNVASWTLKVEVQAAIIFPLFHLIYCRTRMPGRLALFLALILLSFLTAKSEGGTTRIHLYLFYLGYLIPPLAKAAPSWLGQHGFGRGLYLFFTAALLAVAHLFGTEGESHAFGVFFAAAGAFLLLIALLRDEFFPLFAVLDYAPVRFLGTVSYSFYLYNLFTVDLTARFLSRMAPGFAGQSPWAWPTVFIGSTLFGLACSPLSYRLVERSGIRLGGHFFPSIGRGQSAVSQPRRPLGA